MFNVVFPLLSLATSTCWRLMPCFVSKHIYCQSFQICVLPCLLPLEFLYLSILPILLSELPKAQHITQIWGLTTIKQKRHRQYSHLYILISCYHKEASHSGGLFKVFDLLLVLISCVQLIANHKTFHLFHWFFSPAYSGKFPNFSRTIRRVCYRRRQKKTK